MTINRISIGKFTLIFSFYINAIINVSGIQYYWSVSNSLKRNIQPLENAQKINCTSFVGNDIVKVIDY